MTDPTESAFDRLILRYQSIWEANGFPTLEQFSDPSPCFFGKAHGSFDYWQPVRRLDIISFDGIEEALELKLHPSVKLFFQRYFSWDLAASFKQQRLELVQVWNEADTERLLENMIGHLLMQRRLKQVETLFIATTDDDMAVISVVNSTGVVVLESLGKGIECTLADSLAEFVEALEPRG